MTRLKLYTHHLAVRFNEDFSIPLTCKNLLQMCCRLCNMLQLWGRGGMVDTLVLGTSLFGGGSSSLLDPTNFLRMSFKNIGSVLLMCVDAIKVWGNLLELPNSFLKDLGSR